MKYGFGFKCFFSFFFFLVAVEYHAFNVLVKMGFSFQRITNIRVRNLFRTFKFKVMTAIIIKYTH